MEEAMNKPESWCRYLFVGVQDLRPGVFCRTATLKDLAVPTSTKYQAHVIALEIEPGTWRILKDKGSTSVGITMTATTLQAHIKKLEAQLATKDIDVPLEPLTDMFSECPKPSLSWEGWPLGDPNTQKRSMGVRKS
jgi:hypothetical protein